MPANNQSQILTDRKRAEKIINRLYALNPVTVKLGLQNISNLLKHLGNPHKKLNTIHIAGTNGKGSIAFFLNSIFSAAGYKTGMYLSPHLIDIRERIIVGYTWIPEKRFIEITDYIFRIMEKEELSATFFEFITAVAFFYFYQEKVDIGIIEVGLGGRLDATNVLTPLVSIIAEIGLEHTHYLGSSIKEIALEKGGIIKPNGTVFIAAEHEEAVTAIKSIVKKEGATCFQHGKDYVIDQYNVEDHPLIPFLQQAQDKLLARKGKVAVNKNYLAHKLAFENKYFSQSSLPQTFSLEFQGRKLKKLEIKTAGTYQIKNSSTAAAVALYLSKKYGAVDDTSIYEGLKNTSIPCRMELVQKSPQIVLDVAHNIQAIQILIENLSLFFTYKRLIVVLGILKDKDYKKIIKILSSEADIFIMTEPKTERALPASLLEKEALDLHTETFIEKEIPKALNKAKEIADPDSLILVTGSFFTVGEVLSEVSR